MKTALVVTLIFVALTSLLGGIRHISLAPRPSNVGAAVFSFLMTAWLAYLAFWQATNS